MDHKSVDINQRIPLGVLEVALISFLTDNYSNEYIKEQISIEFSGENRIKKSLRIVNKIIANSPLKRFLLDHKSELLIALKSKSDKNIILIALLNASFVFSFDVISLFGRFLGVQDQISGEAILKGVRAIYGGNRAPENAFYAVVPMFIEAEFIERTKPGIYGLANLILPKMKIAIDLYKASFLHQKGLTEWNDFSGGDPYFRFTQKQMI